LAIALAHRLAGDSAAAGKAFAAAHVHLASRLEQDSLDDRVHTALGLALAGLGRPEAAVRAAEEGVRLMPMPRDAWVGARRARDLAEVYAMTGRAERAIEVLGRLLSMPSDLSPALLRIDPAWDPLRTDPRFQALTEGGP
jgi:tetratricopeptide (TPR) repeat protein